MSPPVYAGFLRRYAAAGVDLALVGGTWALVYLAVMQRILYSDSTNDLDVWLAFAFFPVAIVYYSLLEGLSGTTPGKMLAGIRVVDRDGGRPGIKALGRSLGKLLSLLTIGVGFLMAAFTKRRRALHDIISGTQVVSATAAPRDVAAGGRTMPLTALIALIGALATGVVLTVPVLTVVKLVEWQTAARELMRPVSLEELGQLSPDEPLRTPIPLSRIQGGMVYGRTIIESAPSAGRSEAVSR